jgi:hypothetical protein
VERVGPARARVVFSPGWVRDGTPRPHDVSVRWRLLSANNRQLGRCDDRFGGLAEARSAVLAVQRELDICESEVQRQSATGRWTWQLLLRGSVCAISGRTYESSRITRQSLAHFREELALAMIAPLPTLPRQPLADGSWDSRDAGSLR